MALTLSDFTLDQLVDAFLERVNRDFVQKQNWLARQILEPVIEELIRLDTDAIADAALKTAMEYVRKTVQEWLRHWTNQPLVAFAARDLDSQGKAALEAAGLNPFVIFSALQAAFILIEQLLPYLRPIVNAASEDGSGDRFVLAIEDDETLIEALGLAV